MFTGVGRSQLVEFGDMDMDIVNLQILYWREVRTAHVLGNEKNLSFFHTHP